MGCGEMSVLEVGQIVWIDVRANEKVMDEYDARVVDITSDGLYIDVPLKQPDRVALSGSPGFRFHMGYRSKDGALCRYQATLLAIESVPIQVWKITLPVSSIVTREQRREFARVPVDLPARVEVLSVMNPKTYTVYIRDLSGGGVSVLLGKQQNLQSGEYVVVRFSIPTSESTLDIKCYVIRVGPPNERGYASASLQFLNISETVRKSIIQYVFMRQRLMK